MHLSFDEDIDGFEEFLFQKQLRFCPFCTNIVCRLFDLHKNVDITTSSRIIESASEDVDCYFAKNLGEYILNLLPLFLT